MEKLAELLCRLDMHVPPVPEDATIRSLCYDSRSCTEGSAFFAFGGIHADGMSFVDDAIGRGATCIFSEREVPEKHPGIIYITTDNTRSLFARMCAAWNRFPAEQLTVVGVTGTDGKTTTCEFLYQLLIAKGIRAGILGTVSMDDGTGKRPSPYRQSTPEADLLQAFLRRCVDNGLTHVILECTSHALSDRYDRLATVSYDLALVTTVTSEHLEFHGTVDAYVEAKCNLARKLARGKPFVSTTENPYLHRFLACLGKDNDAYILHGNVPATIEETDGGRFCCKASGVEAIVDTGLRCMAENAMLAAIAASLLTKTPLASILPCLSRLQPVTGRMATIENRLGLRILVDFAHTADAYRHLFPSVAQKQGSGSLVAVFGCAGERDRSKRAPMGKIAATYASHILLTEEDPRKEGNEAIFADISKGIGEAEGTAPVVELVEDRKEAIGRALATARPEDTVLFLGKGHERSIEREDGTYPWDEEKEIRAAIDRLMQTTEEKHPCT
jgi:UDP-N-acetylmuramoyl-L-alanyl-D-glutamate--2,6-diaminopimelate ligase